MVHIKELFVRPQKRRVQPMCAASLAAMLGCWSASKDLHNTAACQGAAEALLQCMRTETRTARTHRPAINYHLARLSKRLK